MTSYKNGGEGRLQSRPVGHVTAGRLGSRGGRESDAGRGRGRTRGASCFALLALSTSYNLLSHSCESQTLLSALRNWVLESSSPYSSSGRQQLKPHLNPCEKNEGKEPCVAFSFTVIIISNHHNFELPHCLLHYIRVKLGWRLVAQRKVKIFL